MGVLPSNLFSISTRPACSSFDKWLERLPFVNPVMLRRNRKSALSHADKATRIASRAGSWTRRFKDCKYSNGVGMSRLPVVDKRFHSESAGGSEHEERKSPGRYAANHQEHDNQRREHPKLE